MDVVTIEIPIAAILVRLLAVVVTLIAGRWLARSRHHHSLPAAGCTFLSGNGLTDSRKVVEKPQRSTRPLRFGLRSEVIKN